jgi:hypothetical protein
MSRWTTLPRRKRKAIRKKFSEKVNALIHYLDEYVGNNYAGNSSVSQLNKVWNKFDDCCPLDPTGGDESD